MTPYDFYSREQSLALLMGAIPQRGNFGWGVAAVYTGPGMPSAPTRSVARPVPSSSSGPGWTGAVASALGATNIKVQQGPTSKSAMNQPVYMGPVAAPPPPPPVPLQAQSPGLHAT